MFAVLKLKSNSTPGLIFYFSYLDAKELESSGLEKDLGVLVDR